MSSGKNHPIIFFGTEDYSLSTLEVLVEHNFNIVAVVTKPDSKRGRGMKLTAPPVKTFALEHDIPVWQPDKLRDIENQIRELQPVAGVLVAYGKIIPQSIIDLFTPGIINLHPSLLPRWRGPSPIEAAISNQDTETGVSIMKLDARMDGGPVYTQKSIKLNSTETKDELYEKLFAIGNENLVVDLPEILSGRLSPEPQDENKATYCKMLSKKDSLIDPSQITAHEAEARVRAHLGFPRTKIKLGDHELIITKASVTESAKLPLSVKFKDGKFLTIDQLIAPSGKTMSAKEFIRGYGKVSAQN